MNAQTKSLLILAATLVAGFALGLFADATLMRGRRQRLNDMRRPPGLVAHLEEVIQPRDAAQADSIRPVLESLARGNQDIIRDANDRLKGRMDSLVARLPMLDAEQRERLTRELGRMPRLEPGGGRGGRGGRGGPPDGRGGPPPGGGPPDGQRPDGGPPPGDRPPPRRP